MRRNAFNYVYIYMHLKRMIDIQPASVLQGVFLFISSDPSSSNFVYGFELNRMILVYLLGMGF